MLRLLGKNSIRLSQKKSVITNALRYQATEQKTASPITDDVLKSHATKYLPDGDKPVFKEDLAEVKHLKQYKQYRENIIKSINNPVMHETMLKAQATLTSLYFRLRFNEYPENTVTYTELSKCLNSKKSEVTTYDNTKMKTLGYQALKLNLLGRLYIKYPRLPRSIRDALVEQLLSIKNMHNIGLTQFGLDVNNQTLLEAYLANEDISDYFGKVSSVENFINRRTANGITEVINSKITGELVPVEYRSVADATAAIFGLMCQKTPALFEVFARDVFNVEDLEIQKTFLFNDSLHTLDDIITTEGLPKVVYKLVAETGRNSEEPMFVVGVFTAEGEKLGEGYASNPEDAKRKAALDACIKYFCYTPTVKNNELGVGKGEIITEPF